MFIKRNVNANCGTCPYYLKIQSGDGQCRINPPELLRDQDFTVSAAAWPEMSPRGWCGKHPRFAAHD